MATMRTSKEEKTGWRCMASLMVLPVLTSCSTPATAFSTKAFSIKPCWQAWRAWTMGRPER